MKSTTKKPFKILGIDPGTNILGYAVIEVHGSKIKLISVGVVRLDKFGDAYIKLQKIFERLNFIIQSFEPNEMAIEAPFYGKNVQSMLKLGRAQGVAIACGMTNDLKVTEYAPKKIKQSITGNGNASKEQVAAMVKRLMNMDVLPKYFDATDALGVAICHFLNRKKISTGKKTYSGWGAFVKENPNRTR